MGDRKIIFTTISVGQFLSFSGIIVMLTSSGVKNLSDCVWLFQWNIFIAIFPIHRLSYCVFIKFDSLVGAFLPEPLKLLIFASHAFSQPSFFTTY